MVSARIRLLVIQSAAVLLGTSVAGTSKAEEIGALTSQNQARLIGDVTWNVDAADRVTSRLTSTCKLVRVFAAQSGHDNSRLDCLAVPFHNTVPLLETFKSIEAKKAAAEAALGDTNSKHATKTPDHRLVNDALIEKIAKARIQPATSPIARPGLSSVGVDNLSTSRWLETPIKAPVADYQAARLGPTLLYPVQDGEAIARLARNYTLEKQIADIAAANGVDSNWSDILDCKHKEKIKAIAGFSGGTYVGSNLTTDESARLLVRGTGAGPELVERAAPRVVQVARSTPWKVGWAVVLVTSGAAAAYQWYSC